VHKSQNVVFRTDAVQCTLDIWPFSWPVKEAYLMRAGLLKECIGSVSESL
jgi:hypothetical protein